LPSNIPTGSQKLCIIFQSITRTNPKSIKKTMKGKEQTYKKVLGRENSSLKD
jgi:hypothetical protein